VETRDLCWLQNDRKIAEVDTQDFLPMAVAQQHIHTKTVSSAWRLSYQAVEN